MHAIRLFRYYLFTSILYIRLSIFILSKNVLTKHNNEILFHSRYTHTAYYAKSRICQNSVELYRNFGLFINCIVFNSKKRYLVSEIYFLFLKL